MKEITAERLIASLEALGHTVFKDDSKPFNLNIIGIRSVNPTTNKFNCRLVDLWKNEGNWNIFQMQATTLPGLKYMKTPLSPKGCAILKEGQYRGVYKLDKHNGKYDALCQRLGDVTVYRDNDKDTSYDMLDGTEQTGKFGINIHRASAYKELENVDSNSAGCQVIQDPLEYDIHMELVYKAVDVWGNSFSYTLINENNLI